MLESILNYRDTVQFKFRAGTDPNSAHDIIWKLLNEFYANYFQRPNIPNLPKDFRFVLDETKENSDENLTYVMKGRVPVMNSYRDGALAFFNITAANCSYAMNVAVRNRSSVIFKTDWKNTIDEVREFQKFGQERIEQKEYATPKIP